MSHYGKILLVADPRVRDSAALGRAAQIARTAGAELILAVFEHNAAVAAVGTISAELRDKAVRGYLSEREDWLRERASALAAEGLRVRTEAVWGSPLHEMIIAKVLEHAPSLVVKDVALEPLLRRVLFTPLDWQLLRLCPVPLLLVNRASERRVRRVIAAVDPVHPWESAGELNDRIVKEALALSIQLDAELHVMHAFEGLPPVAPAEFSAVGSMYDDAYEELRKVHHARLREFAGRHGVPADRLHMRYGPVALALADFAVDSGADVIVMGTVYRSGLERVLIGSTAERILDDLHCDVLAVKPAGFEQDVAGYLRVAPAPRGAVQEGGSAA